MFPAFDDDTKALRKAAIAELEAVNDLRDRDHSRPLLPARTRGTELAIHNEFDRRDLAAQHALTSTARSYMDLPSVCEWRAMVREEIRMARLYQNAYANAPESECSNREMHRYYRTHRVPMRLDGYRRAVARARETGI